MTSDDRKRDMIEQAAKAITEVQYPEIAWGLLAEGRKEFRREQARAALAVFEAAHTPDQTRLSFDPHTDCKCGHLYHSECYPQTAEWGGCYDAEPQGEPTDDEEEE